MATVHVLANPAAGRGRRSELSLKVVSLLEGLGHQVVDLTPAPDGTKKADSWGPAIAAALDAAEGLSQLVVIGGDGLIHHCLPSLANSGVAVGIVGTGTGNDFIHALGIEKATKRNVAQVVTAALSSTSGIDLIRIEQTGSPAVGASSPDRSTAWGATVATSGFSVQVAQRADGMAFPKGQQRYTLATLAELRRIPATPVTVTVDGTVIDRPASIVAVGNTKFFGGGMAFCPDADPTDGQLEVVVVDAVSALQLGRVLPSVFWGGHIKRKGVSVLRGRSVTFATSLPVWADGESLGMRGDVTLRLTAEREALQVCGATLPL